MEEVLYMSIDLRELLCRYDGFIQENFWEKWSTRKS